KSGKTYASPIKTLALPTMAQGCYIESNNTYFLFESGAEQYRRKPFASPLDKYLGFSNSTLGIK
ncbi:MAG: hypothetical protein IJF07_07255, partial [Lachnospiraceae bacterium]|nr:hypothetical protein [Lachnospiraceae bacterium]